MGIYKKVDNELKEVASKVSYDAESKTLTINGTEHELLPKIEIVASLPASPDPKTIYFVTGS